MREGEIGTIMTQVRRRCLFGSLMSLSDKGSASGLWLAKPLMLPFSVPEEIPSVQCRRARCCLPVAGGSQSPLALSGPILASFQEPLCGSGVAEPFLAGLQEQPRVLNKLRQMLRDPKSMRTSPHLVNSALNAVTLPQDGQAQLNHKRGRQ